jgi:hypothetical protein
LFAFYGLAQLGLPPPIFAAVLGRNVVTVETLMAVR